MQQQADAGRCRGITATMDVFVEITRSAPSPAMDWRKWLVATEQTLSATPRVATA
jgi:hypothetical protein